MLPMDVPPETKYVAVGEADVAYQVLGAGPPDLLYFYGFGSQLDLLWDRPLTADYFRDLASFSRLILFDRRGTGLSDPLSRQDLAEWKDSDEEDRDAGPDSLPRRVLSNWEEWAKDLQAVLDAAPSVVPPSSPPPTQARSPASSLPRIPIASVPSFSTTRRLVTSRRTTTRSASRPSGSTTWSSWSGHPGAHGICSSWPIRVWTKKPTSSTPRSDVQQRRPGPRPPKFEYILRHVDVREALPLIQAPTLVFQNQTPLVPIDHGHYLVEHIPRSEFVQLSGASLGVAVDDPAITGGIREFLTGDLPGPEAGRTLATVVFTDIEGSTARLASLGDQRWGKLLHRHDERVRQQISRFGGRAINTTGDGFLAAFDYPSTAIRCGQAILAASRDLGLPLRVGLHTGECKDRGDDLEGIAVHIAARVCAMARASEVLVTRTVRDLVFGTDIQFVERDREYELKGVPGLWKLYVVE